MRPFFETQVFAVLGYISLIVGAVSVLSLVLAAGEGFMDLYQWKKCAALIDFPRLEVIENASVFISSLFSKTGFIVFLALWIVGGQIKNHEKDTIKIKKADNLIKISKWVFALWLACGFLFVCCILLAVADIGEYSLPQCK